jgi:hypothetical protein
MYPWSNEKKRVKREKRVNRFFDNNLISFYSMDTFSKKHEKISQNEQPKFWCETCDYKCSTKFNFNRHLLTDKHKMIHCENEKTSNFICLCGNKYKYSQGLSKHKLKCIEQEITSFMDVETIIQTKDKDKDKDNEITDKELMLTILKENSELKTMILDVCKTMASSTNVTNNSINNSINNSNNKTFNVQVYLNEDCKNALNLSDFVSSIQLQLHDLEETGRLGYVDGISQIINTKLNDLDATMRPIQCSDVKRETLYIKEENKWFKEDDKKEKIKNAIKLITRKNIQQIPKWIKANPGCTDSQSKDNDKYLHIVFNAMSGDSTEEQFNNVNKIVTKVSKSAAIDK